MRFVKGHGTENDFVLIADPSGRLDIDAGLVRLLCDRHAGIGGDGVIRVVRTAAVAEVAHLAGAAEWFMDYRNADGSVGEMCGNGVRVFAQYLLESGLAAGDQLAVATRDGVKTVTVHADGWLAVDIGLPDLRGQSKARIADQVFAGVELSTGNPHLACVVDVPVAELELHKAPEVDPVLFPTGANVEFINVLGDRRIRMRVHERGVGETRSCGTGACAAALTVASQQGESTGVWTVEVPGGEVRVTLDGRTAVLAGPAVLVSDGELRPDWLAALPSPK
ncbi:MAG: diaminopimelate epimerase [Streptosporangiales bacterium]|nr:diaminopimelate epimerase [Streptosporangiales bacterium]